MRSLFRQAGSPEITIGLASAIALWYLFLVTTGAASWGWGAFDLVSFRIFAILLFTNVASGAVEAAVTRRGAPRVALYLAALFVLCSGAYSYLFRFEGTVGLAEGEAYEPIPPAFRSVKKGPLARIPDLAFTLTRVERDNKTGLVEIVQQRVAREIGREWQEVGGSQIRFEKTGSAPLIVVGSEEKGELERAYVKLELEPPGKVDSFMFETLPYDFYLSKPKPGTGGRYTLNVRRGKLSLFDGQVASGERVPVQSLAVSIQDERKFAMLTLRTRPGHGLFLISLALLALALPAAFVAKRRQSPL